MLRNAALCYRLHRKHSCQFVFKTPPHCSIFTKPNEPIELDPALQALLQDADKAINVAKRSKQRNIDLERNLTPHKELEIITTTIEKGAFDTERSLFRVTEEDGVFPSSERKSPAASFGSRQLGIVVLPYEMQKSVMALISESEKPLIHVDAERLFNASKNQEKNYQTPLSWSLHYTPLRNTKARSSSKVSHIKARLNSIRSGTAFASVVMPAQYAVIRAVLEQTKLRLGDEWAQRVGHVVEWGSGTGAGIWAAHHTFQKPRELHLIDSVTKSTQEQLAVQSDEDMLQHSSLKSYIAIEKRSGLSNISRKLLKDVPISSSLSIQNELAGVLHSSHRIVEPDKETIAISAFLLSTIQTIGSKKAMLREMWNSGADLMVIIEDASADGFRDITDARDFLLRFGNEQSEQQGPDDLGKLLSVKKDGAHVVAPCPHDKFCPLAFHQKISHSTHAYENTSSLSDMARCMFTQRLQRPSFVRLTKHDKRGEEDVRYSYVVIRRGTRVRPPFAFGQLQGREGAVARWAEGAKMAKEEASNKIWVIQENDSNLDTAIPASESGSMADIIEDQLAQEETQQVYVAEETVTVDGSTAVSSSLDSDSISLQREKLEAALREESYSWPRINFTPLKRNGHVIIDACMPEGSIMRMTFPRSQGKQIYYDARKSSWGDIFPHAPKHKPVPRFIGRPKKASVKEAPGEGSMDSEERLIAKLMNLSDDGGVKIMKRGSRDANNPNAIRAGRSSMIMSQLKNEAKRRRQERKSAKSQKETNLE